jgi:hypothetical protein
MIVFVIVDHQYHWHQWHITAGVDDVSNLPSVSLQFANGAPYVANIFENVYKNWNGSKGFSEEMGEADYWNKPELKILWHCPFNNVLLVIYFLLRKKQELAANKRFLGKKVVNSSKNNSSKKKNDSDNRQGRRRYRDDDDDGDYELAPVDY